MNKINMIFFIGFTVILGGCQPTKIAEQESSPDPEPEQSQDSAAWWEAGEEYEEQDDGNTEDDTGDKPDDSEEYGEFKDCEDGFDPTDSCQGGWEDSLCFFEGKLWWCESGVWLNEDDKPD